MPRPSQLFAHPTFEPVTPIILGCGPHWPKGYTAHVQTRNTYSWPVRLAILGGLAASAGCQSPSLWPFAANPQSSKAPSASANLSSSSPTAASAAGAIQLVNLMLDVLRVEFPAGTSRNSKKIWNHVDELRIDPELRPVLARNGIRMAVGGAGSWPALGAIFEAGKAAIDRRQVAAQPALPMVLHLGQITETESIFVHGKEGRLSGRTFPAGEKVISIDYAVRPELGGATDLIVHFEIRQDRGTMTWERQADGTTRQVPSVDRHVFGDLSVPVTLRPDEFLVIGMSDATNANLLGARFFSRFSDAGPIEIVLCLSPGQFTSQLQVRSGS